ncbi:class I SAM-dependent methyltransferase [Patescibacteria group bacterium]|nr:class I SAM-dependent methyltransferase [Patescibacteria group bacterium]
MYRFLLKEIKKKKSLARALMNYEVKNIDLDGEVIDIGGGKKDYYYKIFKSNKANISPVDICLSDDNKNKINLECDQLPFSDNYFNSALMFNVLEHIYNYNFLISETKRVLKNGGKIIGFVPFLVNYHPDPNDYFRYTKESLKKIFQENGFKLLEIKEVGLGPLSVNFNNLFLYLPVF